MNLALILIALIWIASTVAADAQLTPTSIAKESVTAQLFGKSHQHRRNVDELVDRYFDSLNESDTKLRRDLTRQVWAEKGKFGTPYGEVEGLDAINALVAGVHKQFPKSTVRRTTKIDGFGAYLRWGFTLSDADGVPILSGVDFAIVDNGKLQLVMGFFDFAPKFETK